LRSFVITVTELDRGGINTAMVSVRLLTAYYWM